MILPDESARTQPGPAGPGGTAWQPPYGGLWARPVAGVVRGEAAVDTEHSAGDEASLVGGEVRDRGRDLVGMAEPPDEVPFGVSAQALACGAAEPFLQLRRDDDPRRNRVAADAAVGVGGGHVLREGDDARLRRAVGEQGAAAVERRRRCRVDDRAAATLEHRGDGMAATKHRPAEVDRHDPIPRREVHRDDILVRTVLVERGRIVVEDVETTERLHRVGDHRSDLAVIGDVDVLRARHPTRACDLLDDGIGAVGCDVGDGDTGTFVREAHCRRATDPRSRAGHDRDPALEACVPGHRRATVTAPSERARRQAYSAALMTDAMTNDAFEAHEARRVEAAAALRDLIHAYVGHEHDDATLDMLRDWARNETEQLTSGAARNRTSVMQRASALRSGDDWRPSGGAGFDDRAVAGHANPNSVGIDTWREGDTMCADIVFDSAFEGAPGRAHGGIVAAAFDDFTGSVISMIGEPAFTGELTVRFVKPVPVHRPLRFRTWLESRDGRKLFIEADAHDGDELVARCRAIYITVDPSTFARSPDPR